MTRIQMTTTEHSVEVRHNVLLRSVNTLYSECGQRPEGHCKGKLCQGDHCADVRAQEGLVGFNLCNSFSEAFSCLGD